jgi:hypothetical protein
MPQPGPGGFRHFVIGVKSAAHKAVLESLDDTLTVVLMKWC